MIQSIQRKQSTFIYRTFSAFMVVAFIFSSIIPPRLVHAQSVLNLPQPGVMVSLSPVFHPAVIKGMKIFPNNPLRFDFIIDMGDSGLEDESLKEESNKLIKYFLASLTVPEENLWVNLSPYEKDRIIPQDFGHTEMGRDLLAQDYLLKQITASLIYPEDDLGKKFWKRVYEKAHRLYGTSEIPINTFNKVWIVPEKAVVFENGDTVFVAESHLKVMLEEDYLALEHNSFDSEIGTDKIKANDVEQLSEVSSSIILEVIIPELEKEVNEGKNFANLRQIYNSMILATWFKNNLKESFLGKIYVNQNKIEGIETDDKKVSEKIYEQYLQAFKVGVYDFIKEDYDESTQALVPRKYFSGGVAMDEIEVATDDLGTSDVKVFGPVVIAPTVLGYTRVQHDEKNLKLKDVLEDRFRVQQSKGKTTDLIEEEIRLARRNSEDLEIVEDFVTDDGIRIFIEDVQGENHAGRDRFIVIAENMERVRHETKELRLWAATAISLGIATDDDIENHLLGTRIQDWSSDTKIDRNVLGRRQQLIRVLDERYHQLGIEAEDVEGSINEHYKFLIDFVRQLIATVVEDFDFVISSNGPSEVEISPPNDEQAIFNPDELVRFEDVTKRVIAIVEAINRLPPDNKREGKREFQEEISDLLRPLTRGGKHLFSKKSANTLSKKKGLTGRLVFFFELAVMNDSNGNPIFNPSQLSL